VHLGWSITIIISILFHPDKSSCKTILSVDYQNSNDSPEDSPRRNEDMDKVIRELTVAVMKSRNVTSLTRALRSRKVDPMSCQISESSAINRGSFSRKKNNLRSSIRSIKNISKGSMSGVSLMRDLWRQTGMKTNGRKLIADGHDNDVVDIGVYPIRDIRCQKKQKNMNSRRNEVTNFLYTCLIIHYHYIKFLEPTVRISKVQISSFSDFWSHCPLCWGQVIIPIHFFVWKIMGF